MLTSKIVLDQLGRVDSKVVLRKKVVSDSASSALHHAVRRGDLDVVRVLLEFGANPSLLDIFGLSPIDYSDTYPELRSVLVDALYVFSFFLSLSLSLLVVCTFHLYSRHNNNQYRHKKTNTITRRSRVQCDDLSEKQHEMWLMSLDQMQELYGGGEPLFSCLQTFQALRNRNELTRWVDLPIGAFVVFVSHEWCGWNHPDPNAAQLKTFLDVMNRLRSGEIDQVKMSAEHKVMYKQDYVMTAQEWQSKLKATYVWIDWSSIPHPMHSLDYCAFEEEKEDETVRDDFDLAVRSIPFYVERSDMVVVGNVFLLI